MEWWIFFIVFVPVVYLVVVVVGQQNAKRLREEAKQLYQKSLASLEREPTSPARRKAALKWGRAYSCLTRNGQGVALFDEVALMNDINAVCGGATSVVEPSQPASAPTPSRDTPNSPGSIEDRLARLAELRRLTLITEQEYEAKRQALLDEI